MRRAILYSFILSTLATLGGCSSDDPGPDDPTHDGGGLGDDGGDSAGDGGPSSRMDAGDEVPGSVVARIVAPQAVVAGEPASFDGSSSTGASVFTWSFGDGKRAGVARAPHIFAAPGSYEVTLAVRSASGARAEAKHTIQVTEGPAAEGEGEIIVEVHDSLGSVIPGASVKTKLGEETTDDKGRATVRVPRGPATMLWVTHPSFASQARRMRLESEGELSEGSRYRVLMIKRAAAQTVPSVEAGAVIEGADGTQLTLPKNALIDASGKPVTGAVQVALTPLDTPATPFAFPSEIEAVDENQASVALTSYGVVEVEISQDGQRLDLAEGVRATLDIPIYATETALGEPLELGGSIPLWSLDEATGLWIQEGEGTIVAGSSHAGLALRSSLGHFSWWNCDEPFPQKRRNFKCCVDINGDGLCDFKTGCYLEGRLCQLGKCRGPEAPVRKVIPKDGTALIFPDGVPYSLEVSGFDDGMQTRSMEGPQDEDDITVVLSYDDPGETSATEIAPGYDQNHGLVVEGEVDTYVLDATGPTWIVVDASGGEFVGRTKVAPQPVQEVDATNPASFFVTAGKHTLTIWSPMGDVGPYRLRVLSSESFIPTSISPAHGSVTLSGLSPIVVGFNQPLKPSSIVGINPMTVNMGHSTTNTASGANLTLTPKTDWPAGRKLRVYSQPATTATGAALPADVSFRLQVASHSGGPWELYPCPTPYGTCDSLIDYVSNETGHAVLVFARRRSNGEHDLYAAAYTGGQWREPVDLAYAYAFNTYPRAALNADGDGLIVWADKLNPSDSSASIVRRVTVSAGVIGTTPEELVSGTSIRIGDALAAAIDELGNEAVMWTSSEQTHAMVRSSGGGWSTPHNVYSFVYGTAAVQIGARAGRFVFAITRGTLRATIYDPSVEEWPEGWGPSITGSYGSGVPRVAINQDGYAYVTAAAGTNVAPHVLGFDYKGTKSWKEFSSLAEGETDTTFDSGCTAAGVVIADTGYAGHIQACSRKSGEAASQNRVWIKPLEGASTKAPVYTAPAAAVNQVHRGSYRLLRSSDGTLHSFRWDDTTDQILYRSSKNGFAGPDRVVYQSATGAVPSDVRIALLAEQEPSAAFRLGSAAVAISVP